MSVIKIIIKAISHWGDNAISYFEVLGIVVWVSKLIKPIIDFAKGVWAEWGVTITFVLPFLVLIIVLITLIVLIRRRRRA